jgi:diguanylate cyclase (GGDEF)-like protein
MAADVPTGGTQPAPFDAAAVVAALPQAVVLLSAVRDPEGAVVDFRYEYLNAAAAAAEGFPPRHRVGGMLVGDRPSESDLDLLENYAMVVDQGVSFRADVPAPPDGHPARWLDLTAARHGDGVLVTFADATEAHRVEHQLRHQSLHDGLTGLPNRTLLIDRLDQAERASRRSGLPAAVFLVDLDRFKEVNDTHGHQAGDDLLVECATRLAACVRGQDTVARLGGDEFVVLCEGLEFRTAVDVGRRLLAALEVPFRLPGVEVATAGSVGLAFLHPGTPAEQALRFADAAMYRAKTIGGSRLEVFDETLRTRLGARVELENDLRRALDTGELTLHLQPILATGTGAFDSAEALVRWHHPRRGLLGAADFVPLAEEAGLVVPLGRWVLRAACGHAVTWRGAATGRPVAVNVSARQLLDRSFASDVGAALGGSGLPARRLRLEVTETTLMVEDDALLANLDSLADLGVTLAIDGFGTGYSSLLAVRRLRRLAQIKIAATLVQGAPVDDDDRVIVTALARLAADLGLQAVAMGVESQEQHDLVASVGCHLAQGFLLARPMPADELSRWASRR